MASNVRDYLEIIYDESDPIEEDDGLPKFSILTCIAEIYKTALANCLIVLIFLTPCLFFYFCTIPTFWPFAIAYLCWMYYDRAVVYYPGRKFPILRKLPMWRRTRNYFPIRMVKTAELPPDKNYLFGAFPHGALCYGVACNVMTEANKFSEAFPGLNMYFATLNYVLNAPLIRELWILLGFRSCSAESITNILNGPAGTVCCLIVGGEAEIALCDEGTNKIYLRKRKGFIKLALKTGASLVPVFSFGETDTFRQPSNKLYQTIKRKLENRYNMKVRCCIGRGFFQKHFGFLPQKTPITTVVGRPITVPKMGNPTENDVDKYHRIFTSELQELFDKFKGKYDRKGNNAVLEIY